MDADHWQTCALTTEGRPVCWGKVKGARPGPAPAGKLGTQRVIALGEGELTIAHAPWEHETRGFELRAPCRIFYKLRDGNGFMTLTHAIGNKEGVDDREVGYREGRRAVVCVELDGVITVDGDRCWWWQRNFHDRAA